MDCYGIGYMDRWRAYQVPALGINLDMGIEKGTDDVNDNTYDGGDGCGDNHKDDVGDCFDPVVMTMCITLRMSTLMNMR